MKDFLYKMYFLQLWEEVNPWQLSVPFKIIGLVPFSWFSLNRLFTLSRLSNGHRIFFLNLQSFTWNCLFSFYSDAMSWYVSCVLNFISNFFLSFSIWTILYILFVSLINLFFIFFCSMSLGVVKTLLGK